MLIVITNPGFVKNEDIAIEMLLGAGVTYLHVRKPGASESDLSRFLDMINPDCFAAMAMHYNHQLAQEYNFGGVHQSAGFEIAAYATGRRSASFHSTYEVQQNVVKFDYIFLSPVFKSISKIGYDDTLSREEIEHLFRDRDLNLPGVVALGGVDSTNAGVARAMGFHGVALLGGVWVVYKDGVDLNGTLDRFMKIKSCWEWSNR